MKNFITLLIITALTMTGFSQTNFSTELQASLLEKLKASKEIKVQTRNPRHRECLTLSNYYQEHIWKKQINKLVTIRDWLKIIELRG